MKAELVPFVTSAIGGQTVQTVSARQLHAALEVQTRFNDWIARRIEEYGYQESEDYEITTISTNDLESENEDLDYSNLSNQDVTNMNWGGDRRSVDYRLTLDMAKELAMIENNDKGRQVRRYFIEREAELRRLTAQQHPYPYLRLTDPRRVAPLSADTARALQHLSHDLEITDEFKAKKTPARPQDADCKTLLVAVLEDIMGWRYPFPFAYGVDFLGRAFLALRLDQILHHIREAPHFRSFFGNMHSGARWRLEQEFLVSGLLAKCRRGPTIDSQRMTCVINVEKLKELGEASR